MSDDNNKSSERLIEKINQLEKKHSSTFSNTQKILMTTDGSITSILDVLNGKIDLKTLDQHFEKSDKKVGEILNIEEGEEYNYREVVMHKDDNPLIYAMSYIPIKRLDNSFKSDIIRADIPIGRILKKYNIESRREVKKISLEKSNKKLEAIFKTNDDVLTREYTIIKNNEILIWIKEIFPISFFTEN